MALFKITWHKYPKDRSLLEKIARRFIIPDDLGRAMTSKRWDRYNHMIKTRFPFRWFLYDTFPDLWYQYVVYPKSRVTNFFRYRTIDRYHVVSTGQKPGYQDADTRMLNSAFNLLKDYVEIELASMYSPTSGGSKSIPFLRKHKSLRKKRCPESGLKYLDWEVAREALSNPSNTTAYAREKRFLYTWWTVYRPARMDVYSDPLIWNDASEKDDLGLVPHKINQREYHLINQLEEIYEAEDQEMFHRLINVRCSLWT